MGNLEPAPFSIMLTIPPGLAVLEHLEGANTRASPNDLNKYTDSSLETVIGTWILDHVPDVTQMVQEMVRITDRSAAQPRIILLQGAPWNEVLRFQNAICTPLARKSQAPRHQGYTCSTRRSRLFPATALIGLH
jgi:hypothetical protein